MPGLAPGIFFFGAARENSACYDARKDAHSFERRVHNDPYGRTSCIQEAISHAAIC
jgi:hypothetical protein